MVNEFQNRSRGAVVPSRAILTPDHPDDVRIDTRPKVEFDEITV